MRSLLKITFAIIFCTASFSAFSQEEVKAYELYQAGAQALDAKDYTTAISNLEQSVDIYKSITNSEIDITAVKDGAQQTLTQAYYAYGMNLYQEKDFTKAIEQFQRTEKAAKAGNFTEMIEKAQRYEGNVYNSLAADYFTKEDYDNAIAAATSAIEIDENNEKAYLTRGRAYDKKDDLEKMKADLDKCMELSKNDEQKAKTYANAAKIASNAYLSEGSNAIKTKNYQAALTSLNVAVSYPEVSSNAYYYLSIANNGLSKWNDAIEAANKALSMDLKDPSPTYYELGKAYEGAGKTTEACNAYKKVTSESVKKAAEYQMKEILKCN